jgi:hypothetical protein
MDVNFGLQNTTMFITIVFSSLFCHSVGDGGNEVGMGKVFQKIFDSSIPNKQEIACIVPTNHLVIASVSNWGGYALAAAAAILHTCEGIYVESNFSSIVVYLDILFSLTKYYRR